MKTRIVLLGPPASGKGTQAEMLKARYGFSIASPGAILREEKLSGTALGIEADRLTSKGMMVPDSVVVELVSNWLGAHTTGFVFDGFPRTVCQADSLELLLSERRTTLDVVLHFDVSSETVFNRVMNRMTCGECGRSFAIGLHLEPGQTKCKECGGLLIRRSDDSPEAVERRLVEYREKTEPLVEYYRQRGLLWTLRGAESPENVFAEVISVLEAP